MASKSIRQSLAILAAACGAMKTIKEEQMAWAPVVVAAVDQAIILMDLAMVRYPEGRATKASMAKDEEWVVSRMMDWKTELERVPMRWEYFVLVSIAYQAIVDLVAKVRDRAKLALIEPIIDPLKVISDWTDPRGTAIEAFECAEETLRKLYQAIEFQP